jgi:hypothetical protein
MASATAAAQITIATGPGRGQVTAFDGDVLTIGRNADCTLSIDDAAILDLHATIVQRGGRYAIHAPDDNLLVMDGQPVPGNQWVWLPSQAVLAVSPSVRLHFSSAAASSAPTASDAPIDPGKSTVDDFQRIRAKAAPAGGKSRKATRQTAKFITEGSGETLVRLGEDGHLPNLQLAEQDRTVARMRGAAKKQGNPAVLYGVLGFSVLSSLLLLVLESDGTTVSASTVSDARATVFRDFLGEPGKELRPWQRVLREAGLAHSRGDPKAERAAYQRVLKMLNSEDLNQFTGLTGHIEDDERLRKLLATLLE